MLITLPLFQYPLYSASLAEYNMEQVRTSKTINKWSKHRQTMPLSRWVTTLLRREVGHWTLLSLRGLIKLQRWGDTTTLARVLQHCNLRPIWEINMTYISFSLQDKCDVKAIVVINPGNPTGQVRTKDLLLNLLYIVNQILNVPLIRFSAVPILRWFSSLLLRKSSSYLLMRY